MKKINTVIADALGKTESGKHLIIEAKAIGPRIHDFFELGHSTLVEMPREDPKYRKMFHLTMIDRVKAGKKTVQTPYHLFKAANPKLRELAARGDEEYNLSRMVLQYTWQDCGSFVDTVEMILGK